MKAIILGLGMFFASFISARAQKTSLLNFPAQHFIEYTNGLQFSASPYIAYQKNASVIDFLLKDSLPPFQRYLYTHMVTLPPTIVSHVYLLAVWGPADKWHKKFKSQNFINAFTKPPVFDNDHWVFNYGVHGYMGQMNYLAYRNRGGKAWQAFCVTALNTITYEYILASATQQPSINDMFTTPTLGLILGEGSFQFIKYLKHDKRITTFEKLLILGVDPVETVRNGFDYKRMLARPY